MNRMRVNHFNKILAAGQNIFRSGENGATWTSDDAMREGLGFVPNEKRSAGG